MQIAPRGKEATYMAVANIPIMFGAMFSGVISGSLLQNFCSSDDGEGDCYWVWLIIALISSSAVFLTILLRSCIEEPEKDSEPFLPCVDEANEK